MRYYAVLLKAESMEVLRDKIIFIASESGPFVEVKREDVVAVSPSTFPPDEFGRQSFEECCKSMEKKEAGKPVR